MYIIALYAQRNIVRKYQISNSLPSNVSPLVHTVYCHGHNYFQEYVEKQMW